MPLRLIRPGGRKGNKVYLVRGTAGGKRVEVSTQSRDRAVAENFKARLEVQLLERKTPRRGERVTFRRATEAYIAAKEPSKGDRQRIEKLQSKLGAMLVSDIMPADLVDAAKTLYPKGVAATKNRGVVKLAAAILHYAAENQWCEWKRFPRFKEPPPETRASSAVIAQMMLTALASEAAAAANEQQRHQAEMKFLLILWLFRHWNRISEILRLDWEHIDLEAKRYYIYISKTARWKTKPIDPEVLPLLAAVPVKTGPLFPWRTRGGVYKWLRPLTARLDIIFTPHMARHYGGKELNRQGKGLKTIMEALDQTSPEMAARYQSADGDMVRQAMAEAVPIWGRSGGKSAKRRRNA